MITAPTFAEYRAALGLQGTEIEEFELKEADGFSLTDEFIGHIKADTDMVFICEPNNPTGVCFRREEVEAIIRAAQGIVVVDEAYGAFSRDSFLPQAGSVENLVVMRTISKIGFAGLRIGYAAGSPAVMGELAKILPPYNMNQLSLATAKFALQHHDAIQTTIDILKAERERVFSELSAIGRLKTFPSEANFITVRVPDADALFNTLKENRILIKKLHGTHPLLAQCVRITIGSPEQNDAVLDIIRKLYA